MCMMCVCLYVNVCSEVLGPLAGPDSSFSDNPVGTGVKSDARNNVGDVGDWRRRVTPDAADEVMIWGNEGGLRAVVLIARDGHHGPRTMTVIQLLCGELAIASCCSDIARSEVRALDSQSLRA
jgi:hypothetical protein